MSRIDRLNKLELSVSPKLPLVVVFDIGGALYRQDEEKRNVITQEEYNELVRECVVLRVKYDGSREVKRE